MEEGMTLGAVLGAGRPTGSIFQLTTGPERGAGMGQQPESPGTLEKSVDGPRDGCPLLISIVESDSFSDGRKFTIFKSSQKLTDFQSMY